MEVYVRSLDSGAQTVRDLKENTTVRQALAKAGINATGQEVKVNNQPADLDAVLGQSDVVSLARDVDGGLN